MKRLKLFWALCLLLAGVTNAWADATVTVDGIKYNIYDDPIEAAVVQQDAATINGAITIPATVTYNAVDYPVVHISNQAFYLCGNLTSISIPSSVTEIGAEAFFGCIGLTDIYVNWTTPISINAQSSFPGLTRAEINLHVPAGIYGAYATTYGWNSFYIVDAYGGYCGDDLFWGLNPTTGVLTISGTGDMYEYSNYTHVPWHSWRDEITSVVLPDGLTSITKYTFYKIPKITSLSIPEGVTSIGKSAYSNCIGLTSVTIPENSLLTSIAEYAFENDSALTAIHIPATVTSIGKDAFCRCTHLETVTIGNGSALVSVGQTAFTHCFALTSIHIPAGVTDLPERVFRKCTHLETVTFESNSQLNHIGLQAFLGCAALTSITIPAGVVNIEANAFAGCTDLATVTFADNSQLTSIESQTFYRCTSLTSITLPVGITSIGNAAFQGCTSMTVVNIPANVVTIEDWAFYGCHGITEIHIPASVTTIGKNPFASSGLTTITVDTANTVYSNPAGSNAIIETATNTLVSACQNTIIPSSVKIIGYSAFENSSNMSSIDIPASVDSIGPDAFYNCTGLTDMTVHWTTTPPVPANADAFKNVTTSNVNLHLPFNYWALYEEPTAWSIFKQVPVVTAKADPNDAGAFYNTFYHGTKAYALPAGVEAYTAKLSGSDLILTKIAEAGDVLPAGTAVILKSSVQQFEMTPSEETPVTVGENDLQGVDAAEGAPNNCYVLSGPNPSNPDITEVGFYQFSGTLGAHKAYIVLPGGSGAPKRLRFVFESTQDIEGVQSTEYRVQKILRDGHIYILRNGIEYNVNGQIVR